MAIEITGLSFEVYCGPRVGIGFLGKIWRLYYPGTHSDGGHLLSLVSHFSSSYEQLASKVNSNLWPLDRLYFRHKLLRQRSFVIFMAMKSTSGQPRELAGWCGYHGPQLPRRLAFCQVYTAPTTINNESDISNQISWLPVFPWRTSVGHGIPTTLFCYDVVKASERWHIAKYSPSSAGPRENGYKELMHLKSNLFNINPPDFRHHKTSAVSVTWVSLLHCGVVGTLEAFLCSVAVRIWYLFAVGMESLCRNQWIFLSFRTVFAL